MKIDPVEFLLEEADTAANDGMPLLATKYTQIANEIDRLRAKIGLIRTYAMGSCKLSDVDRILAIAKECEAEDSLDETGG